MKIDVTHTVKPDPQGRRLMLDTETGERNWEDTVDMLTVPVEPVGSVEDPAPPEPEPEPEKVVPAKSKAKKHD